MVSDNHKTEDVGEKTVLGRLVHGKRQDENDVIDRAASEMGGQLAQRAPGFRTPHFQGGGGQVYLDNTSFSREVKGFQCGFFFLPFFSLFKNS